MEACNELDFNQIITDTIEDSLSTAAELKAGTALASDEKDLACIQCEEYGKSQWRKSDVPEKPRIDCSMLLDPMKQALKTMNDDGDLLGKQDADVSNRKPEQWSENLIQLVENSEYVFNGFAELLEGSSSLLGGIEKLINNSKKSLGECNTELEDEGFIRRDKEHSPELSNTEVSCNDLSPLVSLMALQKASDIENERIRLLQQQIHAMNESIRETDAFIKQCQKINNQLTEECRRLDECTNEHFIQDIKGKEFPILESADNPADGLQLVGIENIDNEGGIYQGLDHSNRWSMLHGKQHDPPLPSYYAGEGNSEEDQLPRYEYYAAPPYEELECIWETDEEEEEEEPRNYLQH